MRSEDGYGVPEERYSAECVEVEFCELRLLGILRSSIVQEAATTSPS
jgi:hypothetical protein